MNWMLRLAARALEPGEREVVLGDLTERGSSGARPLFDVLWPGGEASTADLDKLATVVCAYWHCWCLRLLPERLCYTGSALESSSR